MITKTLFLSLLSSTLFFSSIPVSANDPISRNNYAMELYNKGDFENSLEQFQKAFSSYPYDETLRKNLAAAYMQVGKIRLDKKDFLAAADFFDHARELAPGNALFSMMRGVAFYLAKNYEAAKFELHRAREIEESTDIYYFLGRTHYDVGELDAAAENLVKAQGLAPTSQVVADLLDKVRREMAVESQMDKGHSSKFEISYDTKATSNLAGAILDALESSYNQTGADLDSFPVARVPVILYTKKDFKLITSSPEWSGGVYDGKIRLPIGGATELTPQLKAVLSHEYTHVVVNEIARGNVPTWLNEGLAEYQGRKVFNPPMAELGRAAKNGGYVDFSSLEGSFSGFSNKQASLAYQQSYSLVNYMIATFGWFNVKQILVNLGTGMSVDAAISQALSGFGLTYPKLIVEWQAYMKKEFGHQ